MTTAFNRWLARPSTHDLLRHLIRRPERCPHHQSAQRQHGASRTFTYSTARAERPIDKIRRVPSGGKQRAKHQESNDESRKSELNPGEQTTFDPENVLGASAHEFGLRMSLSAGVPFVQENDHQHSSFSTLRHEANVNDDKLLGTLIVDQVQHRQNMQMWIEILQFRQRVDGFEGVVDVWYGMRKRNIDLPMRGPEADVLWTIYTDAAITKREVLLNEVFSYSKDLQSRTQQYYCGLHKSIVGPLIRYKPSAARYWHKALLNANLAPTDALKQLASYAMVDLPVWRSKAFVAMYQESTERDLYDECMKEVLARSRDDRTILDWHDLFIGNGDLPSADMFARPEIQRLYSLDKHKLSRTETTKNGEFIDRFNTSGDEPRYLSITRASMSSLVGDVHGIKPKEISDPFVARMFATRAFSLDLIIKGLSFFGIETLGPLATHEMVIRVDSLADLCDKLKALRSMNIGLDDSMFCRLVGHITKERDQSLFQLLASSDQHPEAYDDAHAQEALLVAYLEENKFPQARLALTSLSLSDLETGRTVRSRSSNRMLQHYLKHGNWHLVSLIMHQIKTDKLALTVTSIVLLHRQLLAARRPGHGVAESQRSDGPTYNALDFVTSAYVYSEELSGNVGAKLWVEILKRHSMRDAGKDHWTRLEKLSLWLAQRYNSERFRPSFRSLRLSNDKRLRPQSSNVEHVNPGHRIFSDHLQSAIFDWGFRDAGIRKLLHDQSEVLNVRIQTTNGKVKLNYELWAKGLALLKRLQAHGVPVNKRNIREAFVRRMWIIFGPAFSNVKVNEYIRRHNQYPLSHYVRHANEIWDGELFPNLDTALLQEVYTDKLMIELFGARRRTYTHPLEYADVVKWSQTLKSAGLLHDSRSTAERKMAWNQGKFRLNKSNSSAK